MSIPWHDSLQISEPTQTELDLALAHFETLDEDEQDALKRILTLLKAHYNTIHRDIPETELLLFLLYRLNISSFVALEGLRGRAAWEDPIPMIQRSFDTVAFNAPSISRHVKPAIYYDAISKSAEEYINDHEARRRVYKSDDGKRLFDHEEDVIGSMQDLNIDGMPIFSGYAGQSGNVDDRLGGAICAGHKFRHEPTSADTQLSYYIACAFAHKPTMTPDQLRSEIDNLFICRGSLSQVIQDHLETCFIFLVQAWLELNMQAGGKYVMPKLDERIAGVCADLVDPHRGSMLVPLRIPSPADIPCIDGLMGTAPPFAGDKQFQMRLNRIYQAVGMSTSCFSLYRRLDIVH